MSGTSLAVSEPSARACPRRSILVPTHDTRELTLACLAAVVASCGADEQEIVLVDDASQDGTAPAVKAAFPSITIVALDSNRGFTRAVNEGAGRARGEHLVLLNSDTVVAADALTRLSRTLDETPALGAVGAQLFHPSGEIQWSSGRDPSLLWLFVMASGLARHYARIPGLRRVRPAGGRHRSDAAPVIVDWVPATAMAVRREVWLALGGFDTRYALYAQDLDLCGRMRRAGWKVALEPRARVTHHLGATIGAQAEASAERAHLAHLWADLVRWAEVARGPELARKARAALRAGGYLRLALDRILRAETAGAHVAADRDRLAIAAALTAIARMPGAALPAQRASNDSSTASH